MHTKIFAAFGAFALLQTTTAYDINFNQKDADVSLHDVGSRLSSLADTFSQEAGRIYSVTSKTLNDLEKTYEKLLKLKGQVFKDQLTQQTNKFKTLTVDDMEYEVLDAEEYPDHRVRIRTTSHLCDPTVKQHSGYLDVGGDDPNNSAHLFFWLFESRSKPKDDPFVLWVNGGPGASSSMGLLMELGPCNIEPNGNTTSYNKYGWNEASNILFLDQPVKVGYSYGERRVESSRQAAHDLYVFLQLLYKKLPFLADVDFHITGESYGGTYIPNFAAYIVEKNKEITETSANDMVQLPKKGCHDTEIHMIPTIQEDPKTSNIIIPLQSVFIGNGLTDPIVQFPSYYDYACDSEYKFLGDNECASMQTSLKQCVLALKTCQSLPSKLTCGIATARCWSSISSIQTAGINPYDIREPCEIDENLCYEQTAWITKFLNKKDVKKQLGVPKSLVYKSVSDQVHSQFTLSGDLAHSTQKLIPFLLDNGIRAGFYSGEYDAMCNWLGNLNWMQKLSWEQQDDFNNDVFQEIYNDYGNPVGIVKKVGEGAGRFTYIKVYDAGHMVPYNQPESSLYLFKHWIADKAF